MQAICDCGGLLRSCLRGLLKEQIGGSKEVRLESRGARIADAVWDLGAALPLGRWKLSRYQHLNLQSFPTISSQRQKKRYFSSNAPLADGSFFYLGPTPHPDCPASPLGTSSQDRLYSAPCPPPFDCKIVNAREHLLLNLLAPSK